MLTESEVDRSFRRLFKDFSSADAEVFERAETLLDELRPESPLRHRLLAELDEIREHSLSK